MSDRAVRRIWKPGVRAVLAGVVLAGVVLAGCQRDGPPAAEEQGWSETGEPTETAKEKVSMTIKLKSSAFDPHEPIPSKYAADGANISPPLNWSELPEGTEQMALIVDDPDAPRDEPFVHWVIYTIPADAGGLPENVPGEATVSEPGGATQGVNDFGETGYGGPAPPKGHGVHHYHFKLYALGQALNLEPGLTKQQLLEKIQPHLLGEGELIGTYER